VDRKSLLDYRQARPRQENSGSRTRGMQLNESEH
jgi:hypothetical protein